MVLAQGLLFGVVTASWSTFLVDGTTANTGTAIRARDGVLHVAFYSDAGLKYARNDGFGWTVDTLDSWTGSHNSGPSLKFNDAGQLHIAYYRGTPWLARWTGTEWQHEEIDTDSSGDYISLAFDSLARPHVAYNRRVGMLGSDLKYAWRDSTGWHAELVDLTGGYDCALDFEGAGRPMILDCESWSDGAVYYRVRADSGWTKETILATDASQSSMVLDSVGRPCISYYWTGGEDFDLRFARLEQDTWRFDLVDHGLQPYKRGWDNAITVDGRGIYHISYHAHNELELRYAWGRPGNWTVEVVDAVGMWNLTSSIALDDSGRACIAYCDENEGDALYVAIRDEPVDVAEPGSLKPQAADFALGPTVVRGVLVMPGARVEKRESRGELLDLTGRKVLDLVSGANDVSRLVSGVYFVRSEPSAVSREPSAVSVRKVVIP
jgi:hypothetical protein